jgi:membrane glycosyltransferase
MNIETNHEGQLVENVLEGLEHKSSERIFSKDNPDEASVKLTRTTIEEKQESIRKEFEEEVSVSAQTQRLYFVIRSTMMSVLGALTTFIIVWYLGTINVMEDFVLGISTYTVCLALSRMFDERIANISRKIVLFLGGHTKLRDFIVKNF